MEVTFGLPNELWAPCALSQVRSFEICALVVSLCSCMHHMSALRYSMSLEARKLLQAVTLAVATIKVFTCLVLGFMLCT